MEQALADRRRARRRRRAGGARAALAAHRRRPRAAPRRDPPPGERGRPHQPRRRRVAVRQRHRPDGRHPLEGHLRLARGERRRLRARRPRARGHQPAPASPETCGPTALPRRGRTRAWAPGASLSASWCATGESSARRWSWHDGAGLPMTNEDAWALASHWGGSRYMTPFEAVMWRVEADPRLRSTMTVVYLLDCTPDWDRLVAAHDWASRLIPRVASAWSSRRWAWARRRGWSTTSSTWASTCGGWVCPSRGRCGSCSTSRQPTRWRPSTARARRGARRSSKGSRTAGPPTC